MPAGWRTPNCDPRDWGRVPAWRDESSAEPSSEETDARSSCHPQSAETNCSASKQTLSAATCCCATATDRGATHPRNCWRPGLAGVPGRGQLRQGTLSPLASVGRTGHNPILLFSCARVVSGEREE